MTIMMNRARGGALAVAVVVLGGAGLSVAADRSPSGSSASGAAAVADATADATADVTAGTTVEWPVTRCGTYSGKGCAPVSDRVDVQRPKFSHPTLITNPLFPISALDSVVLLGEVDGLPFRSETTLIPGPHTVIVDGKPISVVVSQYTAYLDGRIDEVAIDRYAQADDGSVWYLGEDVFDYRSGLVAITEGTWLAGRDGPPAMIMPANPHVGDVFRAENVTGVVFEELTVTAVNRTVNGPNGPVSGAVIMKELHLDGSFSDKVFAPRYGEFDSSHGGDVEALALATPTDRINAVVPSELRRISTSAWGILENVRLTDWEAAQPTSTRMELLWKELRAKKYPPRVADTLTRSLKTLKGAVTKKSAAAASQAAIDVAQSALDLELLYRGNVEVDRFNLHAQQLREHATRKDRAGVSGEVAALEWIRDRLTHSVSKAQLAGLDVRLPALRAAATAGNMPAAADQAARAAAQLRGP